MKCVCVNFHCLLPRELEIELHRITYLPYPFTDCPPKKQRKIEIEKELSATCLLSGEPACASKLTPFLLPRHTEKYPVPLLLDGSFIVCGGYFFYYYT